MDKNALDFESTPDEIERAFRELSALCAENDPADDDRLNRALAALKREAKQQARRSMGVT